MACDNTTALCAQCEANSKMSVCPNRCLAIATTKIQPPQYVNGTKGRLMMLPTDVVLIQDKNFKKWVRCFARVPQELGHRAGVPNSRQETNIENASRECFAILV